MVSREYLSFSKRERTGIITLVILLIIMAVVPKFICHPKPVAMKLADKQVQQLAENKSHDYRDRKYKPPDTIYVPGYIPSASKNYQHYGGYKKSYRLNTGGTHYGKENRSLRRFGSDHGAGRETNRYNDAARQAWVRPTYPPRPVPQPIDINTADTSAFIALPGIGSKLANRIVLFRTKLGGFNSIEQIRKVYGLQDSVFLMIQPWLTCNTPPG